MWNESPVSFGEETSFSSLFIAFGTESCSLEKTSHTAQSFVDTFREPQAGVDVRVRSDSDAVH